MKNENIKISHRKFETAHKEYSNRKQLMQAYQRHASHDHFMENFDHVLKTANKNTEASNHLRSSTSFQPSNFANKSIISTNVVKNRILKTAGTVKTRTLSQPALPQMTSQMIYKKPATADRWVPRRFQSVLSNLNEHLGSEQKLATLGSEKLDDGVFHSWFNAGKGSSNMRNRSDAKNNFLQNNNCETNLFAQMPEFTKRTHGPRNSESSVYHSKPQTGIPQRRRKYMKGNEMRFFNTGMEPAVVQIEREQESKPFQSGLTKSIDFPKPKIYVNLNKQPVNIRMMKVNDSAPAIGDWKIPVVSSTLCKAQKQQFLEKQATQGNTLKKECEQALQEEISQIIKTNNKMKLRKTTYPQSLQPPKVGPTREVPPTNTLAWFNKKTTEREQKRSSLIRKKQLSVLKTIVKLRNEDDISRIMDQLVFPNGKIEHKKSCHNYRPSHDDQMRAMEEESDEDRLNFYQQIDDQIEEMNEANKRKELNVADEDEMRAYATKQAKIMMETVFREKLVELKAEGETTQGDLASYQEFQKDIKSQIGLQIYAVMTANSTLLKHKKKQQKAYNDFLNWLINGLVSEHTTKNMNFSTWKDFRQKRNARDDESSCDSFYPGIDSDYECRDLVEEKAMTIVRENKYRTVFKQSFIAGDDYRDDLDRVYQTEVKDMKLPLSQKVFNKHLILQDYTLTVGQCKAFAAVLQQAKPTYLRCVILENCGVGDDELARFFESLQLQTTFRSFQYKQNHFLQNSLQALKPILDKPPPSNLHELVMVSVKSQLNVITELCSYVKNMAHHLRSLRLVSMDLSANCIRIISKHLHHSPWMTTLDLTNNKKVAPPGWLSLLEVLNKNRTLSWLNLSHNMLVEVKDQQEQGNISHLLFSKYSKFAPIQDFVEQKHASERASRKLAHKSGSESHSETVARCLSNLCKHSPCIQYVDFELCGLSHMIVGRLLEAIRRAKSLQSFHVGYNPGIGAQMNRVAKLRLKMKNRKPPLDLIIERSKNLNQENLYSLEGVKAGRIAKQKTRLRQFEPTPAITEHPPLTLTRIIGHREEMPGSGRWQATKNCWMRDLHQFSLVLWGSKIDEYVRGNGIQVDVEQYSSKIIDYNTQIKRQMHYATPVLCSEQTNWKARPMQSLLSYLQTRNLKQPDFHKQVKNEYENDYEFQDFVDEKVQNRIGSWVEKKDCVKEEMIEEYKRKKMVELRGKYEEGLVKSAESIIRGYGVFNPVIINHDLIDLDPMNVYVLPIVLKPGKHNFFIFTNENGTLKPHYMRHVSGCRQDPVPQFTKTLKKHDSERQFDLKTSVFRDWRYDDDQSIKKCIDHDTLYWKVDKLKGPDGRGSLGIVAVLRDYWPHLNEFFLVNVSRASYPTLDIQGLRRLCQSSRIIDGDFTKSMLDLDFTATITEEEENTDPQLMRYQFFEILVRISIRKYLDTHREHNIAMAFERLIKEHVLTSAVPVKLWEEWAPMRKFFWTLGVGDLLEHNLETVRVFYQRACKQSNTKVLTRQVAVDMFSVKYENIGVDLVNIQQAYGLSKMTVIQETEHESSKEYDQLQFVEFLDMICRLTYKKFEGMQATFQKKLCIMLENLMKQEGLTVEMPPEDSDSESETDEDY